MITDLDTYPFYTRVPAPTPFRAKRSPATKPAGDIYDRLLSGAVMPAFVLRKAGLIDGEPQRPTHYND